MSGTENKESTEIKEYTYAILQETSGEESESWLYFIRYQGNEEALEHLSKQLEKVDWYILDDLSTFDIEMKYLVKEQTAKDMTKVDLNHHSPHRKFDGKLQLIDLGLKDHYSNEKKLSKVFDILGYGQIEEYIDKEDFDPEDFTSASSEEEEEEESTEEQYTSEDESEGSEEETSEEEDDSNSSSEEEEKSHLKNRKKGTAPKIAIPRIAKFKQAKKEQREKKEQAKKDQSKRDEVKKHK
jgi:hypothetical protein